MIDVIFSKEYGRLTLDENIFYEKADWKKYPLIYH